MVGLIASFRSSIISHHSPEIYNMKSIKINEGFPSLEHVFPKCYMNKMSYNDLHNIYKCNNLINNCRSNYKYTDFSYLNRTIDLYDFKKLFETDNYISNKYKLFVPEEASRGIISRSIMYMSFEYNYKFTKIIDRQVLIDWCFKHPPTKDELYHNHLAFMKQFKRNKFIDLYHKKNYKDYVYKLFS
jgi:endonuclease I